MLEFKILIIVAAFLLLIAPEKVPEMARALGKMVRMFNAAKEDMERTIRADMFAVEDTASVFTGTKDALTGKQESLASSLYKDSPEDEEEEEE